MWNNSLLTALRLPRSKLSTDDTRQESEILRDLSGGREPESASSTLSVSELCVVNPGGADMVGLPILLLRLPGNIFGKNKYNIKFENIVS